MRGLTIIVADMSSERFRAALSIAAAQAALGGRARIFLQGEAVSIVRKPMFGMEDVAHKEAGLPTLPAHFDEALQLGVEIIACQSGMHLIGAEPRELDERIQFGGLVSVMQSLGDDRLVIA